MLISEDIKMAQLRNAERTIQQVEPLLSEVFNEFVIIGFRKLEDHESKKIGETTERPYWFVSGSPVMGGALIKWALEQIVAQMVNDGTFMYMNSETGKLEKLPVQEVIRKLTEEK